MGEDYGLLGGIAQGFQAGIQAYTQERDRQLKIQDLAVQRAIQKRQLQDTESKTQLEASKAGFLSTPDADTGVTTYKYDPDSQAAKVAQQNQKLKEVQAGVSMNPETNEYQLNPRTPSAMTAQAALTRASRPLVGQANITGGKMLNAPSILKVNEGNAIPTTLVDIDKTITENSDLFGPVMGRINEVNPYNERAQTINANLRSSSQQFGRYMEGGVLRKEDEEKYRKMFPQLSDSPGVAKNKLMLVDRMLKQKQASDVAALSGAGYDTNSLDKKFPIPSRPGILSGKRAPEQGALQTETKVVGGKEYRKVPGGWQEVK